MRHLRPVDRALLVVLGLLGDTPLLNRLIEGLFGDSPMGRGEKWALTFFHCPSYFDKAEDGPFDEPQRLVLLRYPNEDQ